MRAAIGFLPAAVLMSAMVAAQAPPDPLEACAQKSEGADRLACFDQEMQRRHAKSAPRDEQPGGHADATVRAPEKPPTAAAGGAVQGGTRHEGTAQGEGLQSGATKGEAAGQSAASAKDSGGAAHSDGHERREPAVAKEAPKPVVAQIARTLSHPDHRYTFILDNGQVWEQAEGRLGLFVDPHETVKISSSGLFGGFFLETARHQVIRVRRVQ